MKVAISLPDSLYEQAETLAAERKISRSALYAAALKAYLMAREDDAITAKLNQVYSSADDTDTFLKEARAQSAGKLDEWK